MENTFFKCDGEGIVEIEANIVAAQNYMDKAYTDALALQKELQSREKWTGNSELVAEAFLDLLVQYQAEFYGEGNPQDLAEKALIELKKNMSDFFKNFPEYVALEGRTE